MRSISSIRGDLTAWAAEFDPTAVTIDAARDTLADIVAVERIAAAAKAQLAARLAQSGSWRQSGDRSAAHELARETGTTVSVAREALETGARLRELPDLAEVASRGELSMTQTAAVAAVGVVAPDLVPALIERAQETTVDQLREDCSRALASREPDPEAKRRRIHDERSMRQWADPNGAQVLQVKDNPEVIATLLTKLAPARETLFEQARARGERIRPDALDVDALVATVNAGYDAATSGGVRSDSAAPHRCAPRAKVLVRVDFDALLRGRPIDGEVCEIAGYGPIAMSAVRELLATGDAVLAGIVTKGERVVGIAHLGRKALAIQATALEWADPSCAVDGCTQTRRLEIDHEEGWSTRRITLTELLDRLCEHHHDLKTYEGWAFTTGQGRRRFVSPADPRHPNRRDQQRARGDPSAA